MGASGRDVLLSEQGLRLFPYAVECKSRAAIAVFADYLQAQSHTGEGESPLLVIKQNHSDPLAVVSLKHFMSLVKEASESNKNN